jgi:hypothetical protein
MANPTGGFGFAPVGRNGGVYNGATERAYIAATTVTTAVFNGDTVKMTGTASADGYPEVTLCAATDAPWGVVVGVEAIKTNLEANNYRPASTAASLKLVPVEDNFFKVRLNGSALGVGAVGSTTIYVVAAGSTTTGYSGILASATDAGTSVADELRIVQIIDRPDNDPALATPEVIVQFNDSQTKYGAAGV